MLKRFVEGASIICLVLAFAVPAASFIDDGGLVMRDGNGQPIVNTFFQLTGHNPNVIYGTDASIYVEPAAADTKDICIGSGGMPAWFLMQVPEETGLEMFWMRAKESVSGATHSYTWGDWVPFYVGGEYRDFASNAGLWDSLQVVFCGAAYGSLRVYHRMELISDD